MRLFSRLARMRHVWTFLFLLSLGLNATITSLTGIPGPEVHDEFSYLLAADTFAHGRLTNPPHPFWQHFESFHILQQPTYQSKYQPGQGLILALGQVLTGLPIAGAWLSSAMAAALIGWALAAYLPKRWAVLAGVLAAFHPLLMLWGQDYWGGSLATIGGALVFGAAGRLSRKPSASMAALLGLGVVLLFNSRPYEGLIFTILVTIPLLWKPVLSRPSAWFALVGVFAAAVLFMGYYDYRVAGSPFKMPYQIYEHEYGMTPLFLWQSLSPEKAYRHESLRQFNEIGISRYTSQRHLTGFLQGIRHKLSALVRGYWANGVLILALAGLPCALRRRRTRWMSIALLLFIFALMPTTWTFPHYAAPAFVLLMLIVLDSLRNLFIRQKFIFMFFFVLYLSIGVLWIYKRWQSYPDSWVRMRQSYIAQLLKNPGDDLVIVHYDPESDLNFQWVYNNADINHSPIVWAQDMGDVENRKLIQYFKDRKVWLLEVDKKSKAQMAPYPRLLGK